MPPVDQNKTKDNESQNNREYVQDQLREHEMEQMEPSNINAEEMDNEEMGSVQEKEPGGGTLAGALAGSGGGALGKTEAVDDNQIAATNTLNSSNLSGITTAGNGGALNSSASTEVNETIGNTPTKEATNTTGEGTATPPDTGGDQPLLPGAGPNNQSTEGKSEQTNVNEGASENSGNLQREGEEGLKSTANLEEVVAVNSDGMSKATAALQEILKGSGVSTGGDKEDANSGGTGGGALGKTEGGGGALGATGAGSGGALGATGAGGGALGGGDKAVNEANNLPPETTETTKTENTTNNDSGKAKVTGSKGKTGATDAPKVDTEAAGFGIADLEEEIKLSPEEMAREAKIKEIEEPAKDLGRMHSLDKKISRNAAGEFTFNDFPSEKEKEAYLQTEKAKLLSGYEEDKKVNSAFLNAYVAGMSDGKRLKQEIDAAEKQKAQDNDPEYQLGLKEGTKAGGLALSEDSVQKADGKRLSTEAFEKDQQTKEYKKSESYRKAFMKGYNESYYAAQIAANKKAQEAKAQLMAKPNYKAGYDLGHKIGIAQGREVELEGISDPKTIKNNATANKGPDGQEMDSEGLYKKGFLAGFSNGLEQGQKALYAEQQKEKKDLRENEDNPQNIIYTAGSLWGTISAMGNGASSAANKATALEILLGKKDIASMGEGFPSVPQRVIDFYKAGGHLTEDPVDKKLFNQSFIEAFSNAYTDVQQRRSQQEAKQSRESDEYKKGKEIGETAGAAAFLLQKFQRKARTLQQTANELGFGEKLKTAKEENSDASALIAELTASGLIESDASNAIENIEAALKLNGTIIALKTNIDKITAAFQVPNINEDYKKGYMTAYSGAYQKAKAEDEASADNANAAGTGSSEAENQVYQEGYAIGLNVGAKLKQLQLSNSDNPEKLQKIKEKSQALYQHAKDLSEKGKGPAYLKGYIAGYNEGHASITGGKDTGNLSDEDKTKATQMEELVTKGGSNEQYSFNNVDANTEPYGKEYLKKGFDFGYSKWYEYEKTPKDQQPPKTPDAVWLEKRGNTERDKLTQSIQTELDKDKKTDGKAEKLAQVYENGYRFGEFMGKTHGFYYRVGFEVGAERMEETGAEFEKAKNTNQYVLGHKAGKDEFSYQNFRTAALKSGQLIEDYQHEESLNERLEGKDKEYAAAYKEIYNKGLVAFMTAKGLAIPKALEDVNFDIPKLDQNYTPADENEKKALATEKGKAELYINKQDLVIDLFVKERELILIEQGLPKETGQNKSTDQERQEKIQKAKDAAKPLLEPYKEGLKQALKDAEAKASSFINQDQAYNHGVLAGYGSTGAKAPDDMNNNIKEAKTKEAYYEEDPAGKSMRSDFRRGYLKGVQLGSLRLAGSISELDLAGELGSSATQVGYKKGVENAQEDISTYKQGLKEGNQTLTPAHENSYTDLPEDQQQSYIKAFQQTYALGKTYEDGYHQGFYTATNDDTSDDYRLYNYEVPEKWKAYKDQLPARYQQGIVDGREAGFIEKYGGDAQSKELAFHRRINQIREDSSFGNVYADAYELGYREGVKLKQASGANIASIQMILESDGPDTLAADFAKFLPEHVSESLKKIEENLSEEDKDKATFLEGITEKALPEAEKVLDDNKPNKDRVEKATEILLKEIDDLILEKYTTKDRNEMYSIKADLEKELKKYLEGYIKGARKGTVEGIDLDKAKETAERTDQAADFQQQMMDAVLNQGNDHYIKGYQQAREIVLKLAKEQPDITTDQLASQRYKFAQIARQKIIMLMGEMSKEMMKRRPSPEDVDNYAHFREQNTGLLHIINHLPREIELKIIQGQDQDEFIEIELGKLFEAVWKLIEDFNQNSPIIPRDGLDQTELKTIRASAYEYLKEQYEDLWKPFIEHYRKGFNAGYSKGINEVAEGRQDGNSASVGEATDLIDKIYEQLKAGKIEDGDVADLDWLSKQHLMLNEIYQERKQVELDDALIYDTDVVIFDLLDEVDTRKLYKTELQERLNEATSDEFMPIVEEMQLLDMEIEALEEEIDQEEQNLDEIFARIDSQAEEFRQFTRDNMNFEAPESSNSQIREYLLKNQGILELEGSFTDEEGNAEITGPGKLVFDDRALKWQAIGNIFLGLGDLELTSSGATVHHTQYYVELQPGEFKVPYYDENGRQEFKSLHENLELKMGIGMLSQIDQQLHLDEKLSAGAILMSDIMDWFGL
jgi:hypothetical protein